MRYREVLWSGYNYLKEKNQFDVQYFVNIFNQIKQVKEDILPDFSKTVIRQGGSGLNAGAIVYTPPKGKAVIQNLLQNLVDFMNDDEKYPIDHLLKMAIAHFQFEAIHPFRDGNGRTGRILNIHYITQKQLLDYPILFLSKYILENKDDYYKGLQGVSQRGNWNFWLMYMLDAVEQTANLTYHKINDIVNSRDDILEFIKKDERKFRNPETFVDALFLQPYIMIKNLVDSNLYAENTARDYLNRLVELQVLQKKEIGGSHYYLNVELYRILAE